MYKRMKLWEDFFSEPSVSFFSQYNVVDTSKYDIVNGEAVERKDYKKKRLEAERDSLKMLVGIYEKNIVSKSERLEDVENELKEL